MVTPKVPYHGMVRDQFNNAFQCSTHNRAIFVAWLTDIMDMFANNWSPVGQVILTMYSSPNDNFTFSTADDVSDFVERIRNVYSQVEEGEG
jgi:hypothetical protein